jgi:hypothetical protein
VKICVTGVEVLNKKERWDETQFTKIDGKNQFASQLFHFVKFSVSVKHLMPCPIMPRPAILAP